MRDSAEQGAVRGQIQKTTGASASRPLKRLRAIVLPLIVLMTMASRQICRAQDTAAPLAAEHNPGNQNQRSKRDDSSIQPQGQGRMFGIVPTYGLVEAGAQPPPLT